jgi:hypothetical protein
MKNMNRKMENRRPYVCEAKIYSRTSMMTFFKSSSRNLAGI